ncbi:2-keto-4-pentenoate hydratase/2-oxohepta-3-ene-1,7-dioic acid hydratase in catechol pathway [Kineococcus xinjiangensis]|uniref:2-keto-4-pentenoate hydratase/2-oxohepta-3-ene-1,7-dioic acid hydratase in catechol pathway n=1 Tax=Kineococcus xinjiangensis TaxID=512762 RepID=A0A2S6IWX1_9ACTN|nr:fumarylacetoacetate hydrolase family protein [Kineococcus xinjiangensis]PPK98847.1 2-keto-4-pentenoate hydratase/2-oxohepta-3-ene-1,7-dioic acid hydratase in catechol pathway [Kineococcus xinjiangensis]
MRLARVEAPGGRFSGVVVGGPGEEVVHALPGGTTVLDLAAAGLDAAREAAAAARRSSPAVPLSAVRLLPPLEPPSVRDFVAFEEHVEGVVRSVGGGSGGTVPDAWYEAPTFYFANPHSLIGAHDDVAVPPGCTVLDFELEVAAIVGAAGTNLSPAQARQHVFGYTVFNDWSARDLQGREMRVGLGPAKGKDFATTLGPWVVTADELEDFRDSDGHLALELTAEVDGRRVGHDLLSNAGWTFEEMVAYASRGTWVRPGDVLGSGTCGNGGCLAELWGRAGAQEPPPLAPGNRVRLHVEGIGAVENLVVAGEPLGAVPVVPTARRRSRARHRPD